MSEKTVITCDALDCFNEHEHYGGDFLISDITDKGWIYVPEHESHYCQNCKPDVKAELDEDNIEYIE